MFAVYSRGFGYLIFWIDSTKENSTEDGSEVRTNDLYNIISIKSRANILTRVQSKAYTEPSSFSSLFNLPYSKDIHYFTTLARRGT